MHFNRTLLFCVHNIFPDVYTILTRVWCRPCTQNSFLPGRRSGTRHAPPQTSDQKRLFGRWWAPFFFFLLKKQKYTFSSLKVRFFASQEDGLIGQMRWEFCGPFISSCKRLLRWDRHLMFVFELKCFSSALLSAEPRVRRILSERKKSLQKAIEGLGQHGK